MVRARPRRPAAPWTLFTPRGPTSTGPCAAARQALPPASAADQQLLSQLKGGTGPGGGITQQDAANAKSQEQEKERMRQDVLQRVMAPDAKERLARISLVKPDKARKLEDMVMMMAQRGQLGDQLSDLQLKQMLEQISDSVRAAHAPRGKASF